MSRSPLRAPRDVLVHLRRARDHADRHYAEPLDLAALAEVAGLSKDHFHRLFAATYGRSPAAYLSERQIERAQDLLRATNLTVTEICHAVGCPSDRPYGVEAVCCDNSGNWMVLVEQKFSHGKAPDTLPA